MQRAPPDTRCGRLGHVSLRHGEGPRPTSMPPELGPGYELVMELASLQDGRRLVRLGQTLQVAFGDASGQVRSDPKADLIPAP